MASSGLEWDEAERLLTALGFPTHADDLVTAEEAAAIELLGAASTRLLGLEATVQVARVAGTTIARIADTLVGAFRLRFELPRLQGGSAYSDVVKAYSTVTEEVLPGFVQTLDVLLRRQLVAVADRVWSTDAEHTAVTLARTIGFADLVGYTAVSATMSVGELARVLAEFDERVTGIVHRGNGQLVKTLGDEAMFVSESADDGAGSRSDWSRNSPPDRFPRYESAWPRAMCCPRSETSTDPTSTWPLAWSEPQTLRRWSSLNPCGRNLPKISGSRLWTR